MNAYKIQIQEIQKKNFHCTICKKHSNSLGKKRFKWWKTPMVVCKFPSEIFISMIVYAREDQSQVIKKPLKMQSMLVNLKLTSRESTQQFFMNPSWTIRAFKTWTMGSTGFKWCPRNQKKDCLHIFTFVEIHFVDKFSLGTFTL